MLSPDKEIAVSQATGVIILVVITIVLALLLFLAIQLPNFWDDPTIPTIFEITQMGHINEAGVVDDDSYMVLMNKGDVCYDNRKLYPKIYRNGNLLTCRIVSMNGPIVIGSVHTGIHLLGGAGSDDFSWNSGATLYIDFNTGTFHPGDNIQFDIYDKTTDQIISRDTWPHKDINTHDVQWFYHYFLSHRGA